MSGDAFLELAPLQALGALDGEERRAFEAHLPRCPACEGELDAHAAVASRIPLALVPVPPPAGLKARLLAVAVPKPSESRRR